MQGLIRKTFVLLLAAIVVTAGLGLTSEQASAVTGPSSITIAAESGDTTYGVVDYSGQVLVYLAGVYPSYRPSSVTWSIYSGAAYGRIISSASTYCYVQGYSYGTIVLKARSNYYPYATKYIKIYVRPLDPLNMYNNWGSLNLWSGTQCLLAAIPIKYPWVYNSGVSWASSNTSVATIASNGIVTAKAAGASIMTSTSYDLSTLKADSTINVYSAALATPGRVNVALGGGTIENPVNVAGPLPTTTTYVSSNTAAATVDGDGTITPVALGSTTITATVTLPWPATSTKTFTYVVNVNQPVGTSTDTFDFNGATKLEIVSDGDGFTGDRTLLFSKENLDDFFGFGSLGVDLWNPMDMYENFFIRNIAWHIGGFTFDKVGNNVAVTAMVNKNTWAATYALNSSESLDMYKNSEDIYTGYDLQFFYEANNFAGYDQVTLRGNVLTIPFGGDTLQIQRLGYNKIQILADADLDGTVDDVVMTITRNTTGYHVVINNQTYMTNEGIHFNLYNTYI